MAPRKVTPQKTTPTPAPRRAGVHADVIGEPVTGNSSGATTQSSSNAQIICTAIKNYLLGKANPAILSSQAIASIRDSTWPEVCCTVEGDLYSPRSFKNLTVKAVSPGKYKYECVCPDHGDRFVDYCVMEAHVAGDGMTVIIDRVTWDDMGSQSFSTIIGNATWYSTEYGFRLPNCMTPSTPIFVGEVPGSFQRWTYDDVCVACWPSLGAWAVTDYPDTNHYLTEDVRIKSITYRNKVGNVFSGYTNDGRIWYMKKNILSGSVVDHAKVLLLIYPKSKQSDVNSLIEIVRRW